MIYEIQKLTTHGPGEYYIHFCFFESEKPLSEFLALINSQYKHGEYGISKLEVLSERSILVNSILDSGERE